MKGIGDDHSCAREEPVELIVLSTKGNSARCRYLQSGGAVTLRVGGPGEVGQLSLGPGFDGLLLWGFIDDRPFLRCIHSYGLCLWRLGRLEEARRLFERMLWLNPADNQGIRLLMRDLNDGSPWQDRRE